MKNIWICFYVYNELNFNEINRFFCGSGGFSEGFKQMGFEIEYGYDHWRPVVETYNYNFGFNAAVESLLHFIPFK